MSKLSDLSVFRESKVVSKENSSKNALELSDIAPQINEISELPVDSFSINGNLRDSQIAKSLEKFAFPHPQILLSLLPEHNLIDSYELRRRLKTLFLTPVDEELKSLLQCISDSFGTTVQNLVSSFKFHKNYEKYEMEWNKIFETIKFSSTSHIDDDFSLKSLDNLKQLHILGCILSSRIYLLHSVYNEEDIDDPIVFTTFIGPESPKHNCFIYCATNTEFFLLTSLSTQKHCEVFHSMQEPIQTLNIKDQKSAHFLSFTQIFKAISNVGKSFNRVIFQQVIDSSISQPKFNFSAENNSLVVKLTINKYDEQLNKVFTTFGAEQLKHVDISMNNINLPANSQVFTGKSSLISTETEKTQKFDLSSINSINSIKDINQIAAIFDQNGYPEVNSSSSVAEHQVKRMFSMFSSNPEKDHFNTSFNQYKSLIIPEFMVKDVSESPYCDLICMSDILSAAAKSLTLTCSECMKSRRTKEFKHAVFIPHKVNESPFVQWMCKTCYERQSPKSKLKMRQTYPEIHSLLEQCGNQCKDEKIIECFEKSSERVNKTIQHIRNHPVGNQASVISVVDSLHENFISLLKIFRQRMIQMEAITADDLITIKDVKEYMARVGSAQRVVKVPEPDIEIVDRQIFQKFIEGSTEKCHEQATAVLTIDKTVLYNNLQDVAKTSFSDKKSSVKLSMDTPDFTDSLLNFTLEVEGEASGSITTKKYEIREIESNGHITTNIAKLKTNQKIVSVFKYENKLIVGVVNDKQLAIHICPVGDFIVDQCPVLYIENSNNSILSMTDDKIVIASEQKAKILTLNENFEISETEEYEVPLTPKFICHTNDTFYFVSENQSCSVSYGEVSDISNLEEKVKNCISSEANAFAVLESGKAYSLIDGDFVPGVENNGLVTSLNGCNGILSFNEEGKSLFSPMSEPSKSSVKYFNKLSKLDNYNNPSVFDSDKNANISPQMAAFSLCSIFPSLIGTCENGELCALVDRKLEYKVPAPKNGNFSTEVKLFFKKCQKTVSLHGSEEICLSLNCETTAIAFVGIGRCSASQCADSFFGCGFSNASYDGIFSSSKFANGRLFIPVVFENKNNGDIKTELLALAEKRVPTVICCSCTADVYDYDLTKLNIACFVISGRENEKILSEYLDREVSCVEMFDKKFAKIAENLQKENSSDAIKGIKDVISLIATKKAYEESEFESMMKFIC